MTDSSSAIAPDEVPALPAVAPAAPPAGSTERFQFTGRAGEYFGIWIVNLFLSIITLGIYSAWAKVRRKRYFYGNTWVAGGNFEYHGNPVAILKGRLVALAIFIGYSLASQFSPKLGAALALAAMPLVPWLVLRSFAFNAANSSHRNLRFRFSGRYLDALAVFLPLALVPLATLVLPEVDPNDPNTAKDIGKFFWILMVPPAILAVAYPYVVGALKRLHVSGSAFGATRFSIQVAIGSFYAIYIKAYLIAVVVMVVFGMAAALLGALGTWLLFVALPLVYIGFFACVFGYTASRVGNLVFNSSRLGDTVRFTSDLHAVALAKIYAVNLLAIVCTLGLAIPWATIRAQRYRAEHLALECPQGIDAFLAQASAPVGPTAEAVGEFFDLDLSL